MTIQVNSEELKLLNNEILVRGIVEKTKSPGITWNKLNTTVYESTIIDGGSTWGFTLSKTKATGTGDGYNYTLELSKNGILNNSIKEEEISTNGGSSRSTGVAELWNTVEEVIFEEDRKHLNDANKLIFNLPDCR